MKTVVENLLQGWDSETGGGGVILCHVEFDFNYIVKTKFMG